MRNTNKVSRVKIKNRNNFLGTRKHSSTSVHSKARKSKESTYQKTTQTKMVPYGN